MANLIFPSELTRTVLGVGSVGTPLTSVAGQTATVYTDAGGTTAAMIYSHPDNVLIVASQVTVDSNGRLPFFHGPDTTTTVLYVKIGTGPVQAIAARSGGSDDPNVVLIYATSVGGQSAASVALADKGFYAPGTAYSPGHVVTLGGRRICATAHTATPVFDTTKWVDLDGVGEQVAAAEAGELIDDFSDVTSWITASGTAPTLSQGSGDAVYANYLHVVAAAGCQIVRPLLTSLDKGRFVSFAYRVAAGSMTSLGVEVVVGGTTYANRFEQTVGITTFPSYWTRVSVPMSALAAQGAATNGQINDVRQLGFYISGAAGLTIDIADIRIHDNPLPPGVVFTFDDARQSQYTNALSVLQAAGYAGTIYCAPNILGTTLATTAPVMTLAQLQAMKAAGWSVGCHGNTHTDLTTLTSAQRKAEFDSAYNFLLANSLATPGGMHLAYPFGAFNDATITDVRPYFRTARTTTGRDPSDTITPYVGDRFRLRTLYWNSGSSMFSTANAQAAIDGIVARGGIAAFTFHEVGTAFAADAGITISTADLTTIVNYCASKNLPCYTLDDLFPTQTPGSTSRVS